MESDMDIDDWTSGGGAGSGLSAARTTSGVKGGWRKRTPVASRAVTIVTPVAKRPRVVRSAWRVGAVSSVEARVTIGPECMKIH